MLLALLAAPAARATDVSLIGTFDTKAAILSIDAGDGFVQRRVLYPGAGTALIRLPRWPGEVRVEARAGALAKGTALVLTLKALDREPAAAR